MVLLSPIVSNKLMCSLFIYSLLHLLIHAQVTFLMGSNSFDQQSQLNSTKPEARQNRFDDPALNMLDLVGDFKGASTGESVQVGASTEAQSIGRDRLVPEVDLQKILPDVWLVWKDALARNPDAAPHSPDGTTLKKPAEPTPPEAEVGKVAKDGAGRTGFEPIDNAVVQSLLNNLPAEDLPPIAKKFEQYGMSTLDAEEQAEKLRPQIYVSKDRKDTKIPPGANIYGSIQEAVDKAPANSVINVMAGVYQERVALKSGIVIKTDPTNPAVIDNSRRTTGRGSAPFSIGSNVHDVAIKNFEIRNFDGSDSAVLVKGQNIGNITVAGNNIHSARAAEGIGVYGVGSVPISNLRIISNRLHDLRLRGQIEAMPINGNVSDFQIIGNSGYKLSNLFIDVINGEGHGTDGPRGGKIAYNFADRITTVGNPDYGGPSAAGIYSDAGRDLEIYGNYVRDSDFGIEVGSEHKRFNSSDVRVHGNIFESSGLAWLKLGYIGNVNNSVMNNNLVVGNSSIERGNVGANVVVKDNQNVAKRSQIVRLPAELMSVLN